MFITAGGSTIQTLLDDLEVCQEITALLDMDDLSWFKFGRKFEIERDILKPLVPDPIKSPTKSVIEYIVNNDPGLQMVKFIESLKNIRQIMVIEKLKTLFHFSWI